MGHILLCTGYKMHGAVHGIICVVTSHVIGSNKVISQGRDETVKYWDITDGGLSRTPSLTIRTNSYHFCKLSIAKKPFTCVRQGEEPKHYHDLDVGETSDVETLDHNRRIAQGNLTGNSSGHFKAHGKREDESWTSLLVDDVQVEGLKYVVIAGERPYEVEIWDLNTVEKVATLPQNGSSSSLNQSTKAHGYFYLYAVKLLRSRISR